MKAAIAILAILALAGAAWYYQQQTRTLAETVAQQQTELSAKNREIDKLEKALAKAQPAQPAPGQPAPSVTTRPSTGSAPAPQPAQPSPDQTAARIAQIEADHERTKAAHDARQAEINAARTRAEAYIAQAEANRPQFSEQSNRFNENGDFVGRKGIRTSDKDREAAMELYNQQVAAARAGMAKVDEEQAKLDTARKAAARELDRAVSEAYAK
jgi:hypothetical protein